MEGCKDGEWNGHRYFTCFPGRAFFCPVTSLRPAQFAPQERQINHGSHRGENRMFEFYVFS